MIIDGKRHLGFQTYKVRGEDKYHLLILVNSQCWPLLADRFRGWWDIALGCHGQLAMTPPSFDKIYEVSFRKLPDDVKHQVREAVAYIEKKGTPMENDEPIF